MPPDSKRPSGSPDGLFAFNGRPPVVISWIHAPENDAQHCPCRYVANRLWIYRRAVSARRTSARGSRNSPNPPLVPGPVEGYEATVTALKANEAVLSGSKIAFQADWFVL